MYYFVIKNKWMELILKEHIVSQCAGDTIWELNIYRSPDSGVWPTVFSRVCPMKLLVFQSFSYLCYLSSAPIFLPFPKFKPLSVEPWNPKSYGSNLPFIHPLQYHSTLLEFNTSKILDILRNGFYIKYIKQLFIVIFKVALREMFFKW